MLYPIVLIAQVQQNAINVLEPKNYKFQLLLINAVITILNKIKKLKFIKADTCSYDNFAFHETNGTCVAGPNYISILKADKNYNSLNFDWYN